MRRVRQVSRSLNIPRLAEQLAREARLRPLWSQVVTMVRCRDRQMSSHVPYLGRVVLSLSRLLSAFISSSPSVLFLFLSLFLSSFFTSFPLDKPDLLLFFFSLSLFFRSFYFPLL
ncbi:hypothetical protein VTO42DRAFT_4861 [Malbranchea cinnamomea]